MRPRSTTERALRFALQCAERLGARVELVEGPRLNLEPYDPSRPERSAEAARLVALLRGADGVLVATPSYHGSLSGLLKNALDYVEDLRGDARPYLQGRAVGCIVVTDGAQAMGSTLAALRAIVHALRGWPTPYAASIDAKLASPDDGSPWPDALQEGLSLVASQVVEFARMRRAYDGAMGRG